MTDRGRDLIKIKKMFKRKDITPEQIGSLMRQYYVKHIKGISKISDIPENYADLDNPDGFVTLF